jgi:hypothetical protein
MPKITVSLSDLQLVSDAVSRCYTADIDDFKFRLELAQFKKASVDHLGPQSPFAETRTKVFEKYGRKSEGGDSYLLPDDPKERDQLIKAIEEAMTVKVTVPFPDMDPDRVSRLDLPLNASELAVLIACGAIKEE